MPLAGHGLRPTALRRRAGRPQLKRDPLGSAFGMPTNFALALVIPGVLVGLQFRRQGSLRFSKVFYGQLAAYAAPLLIGLRFGMTPFLISLAAVLVGLSIMNRSPRMPDHEEREALRKLAQIDLKAARRLRAVLQEEMKGHRAMREGFLPTVSLNERAHAEAMIEQREQQTQVELQQVEDAMQRLQLGKGAA